MRLRFIWTQTWCAATRFPGWRDGVEALFLLLALGGLAVTLGTFRLAGESPPIGGLEFAVLAFFIPALAEELAFRGPLHPRAPVWSLISLSAFIAWHPIQVWLGLPAAQPLFLEPVFLVMAGALGLACTISRIRSNSLWPPVLIHWIAVLAWKALSG